MERSEIQVGTPVTYWKVMKDNGEKFDPVETTITSEPWELGHGEVVCALEGMSGGFSIRHLEKREEKVEDKNPDNPPAFPVPENMYDDENHPVIYQGMSLRDYYAGQAMMQFSFTDKEGCAKNCFEIADAMLKAREEAQNG